VSSAAARLPATILAGEQILLMYGSANRDESVFDHADVFDVTRRPGDHIAFVLTPR
jgi:cytochrome P450 family 142 subfamily A polypeptide 1